MKAADPLLITATVTIVAGVGCQALARRLRLPAILPLLLAGMLLGPSALGVVQPDTLGRGLRVIVGFAVAIILFEGGLSLDRRALQAGGGAVRNLVTIGAGVTWVLAAGLAWLLFPLTPGGAVLFGSLVIVTGPTVIAPILHAVRPRRQLADVLRAEAVVIDPIGALAAVLVLEVLVSDMGGGSLAKLLGLRLLTGAGLGAATAGGLFLLLRREGTLAPDIKNLVVLASAIGCYALSESLMVESGVLAVTLAGLILGWSHPPGISAIEAFKGQITLLMVSLVFILLSADVSLAGLAALGGPSLLLVAALILVVRPLSVGLASLGTQLDRRERLFLAWIAPRGIIAASVSALFAIYLTAEGHPDGALVRDLTFAVILGTVLIQAPTARWLGRWLDVLEPDRNGVLVLGASRVGRHLARALLDHHVRVLVVSTDPNLVRWAQAIGLDAQAVNLADPLALEALPLQEIGHLLAVGRSDALNRVVAQRLGRELGVDHVHVIRFEDSPPQERTEGIGREYWHQGAELTWESLEEALRRGRQIASYQLEQPTPLEHLQGLVGAEGIPLALVGADRQLHLRLVDPLPPGRLLYLTDRPPEAEETADDTPA